MTVAPIPPSLADFAVAVDTLVPYERNPRRGDVATIRESLASHGQYRPIVVRSGTNQVLAGNHTLQAAKELGWTEVAATFVEVDDEGAARIVLVDNRASDVGTNDDRVLLDLLRELEVSEAALIGTGYAVDDLDDLNVLLAGAEDPEHGDDKTPNQPGSVGESDGNAWESTDLKEYAERYEEQGRRLVVLDYDRADYARVTGALEKLRAELGVDSNSQAIATHLSDRFPDAENPPSEVAV